MASLLDVSFLGREGRQFTPLKDFQYPYTRSNHLYSGGIGFRQNDPAAALGGVSSLEQPTGGVLF